MVSSANAAINFSAFTYTVSISKPDISITYSFWSDTSGDSKSHFPTTDSEYACTFSRNAVTSSFTLSSMITVGFSRVFMSPTISLILISPASAALFGAIVLPVVCPFPWYFTTIKFVSISDV